MSALITITLWLCIIIGWIINVVGVCKMAAAGAAVTTFFILKCIGIFVFPLGAILGLFF